MLTLSPVVLFGQANPPAPPPAAPSAAPVTASSLLQPSIADVQTTLNSLKIDKWKRGSVRDEAADNVKAILNDLQENLPPLITAADAAPSALSQAVPLVKHLDAVYDVLLRVEEASRVSAPADQVGQLQQTLKGFERARIALDDRLQQNAADQEKKMTDLQAALTKAQTEAAHVEKPAPAPEPCKPPAPAKKKKRVTPAAKPAQQGTPAATPPATAKPQ
jgi:hypothetical protein